MIESLDLKRSLIFVVVASVLFSVLAFFLKYDPVLANFTDRAISGNDHRAAIGRWWDEDSVVENVTAGFSAIAAILWLWAISRARSQGILLGGHDHILA